VSFPKCPAFKKRLRHGARNLTGQRFGNLRALAYAGYRRHTQSILWLCQCDCGERTVVRASHLIYARIKSCGCLGGTLTHGLSKSPTYASWSAMRTRCNNPNSIHFKDYGGRGIKVCARWASFEKFLNDMGPRPRGRTLDRKNVNGNYERRNCRWATSKTQAQNKRRSKANKPTPSPQADVATITGVEVPF